MYLLSTVDQTDIRGLLPHDADSSGSYLGLKARVDRSLRIASMLEANQGRSMRLSSPPPIGYREPSSSPPIQATSCNSRRFELSPASLTLLESVGRHYRTRLGKRRQLQSKITVMKERPSPRPYARRQARAARKAAPRPRLQSAPTSRRFPKKSRPQAGLCGLAVRRFSLRRSRLR